jgi:hypothetical protein
LKIDSRSRSAVGRIEWPLKEARFFPLRLPPIMRNEYFP